MAEFSHSPEAKAPYDAALDGFFKSLQRNTATETSIKMVLADLLNVTTGNGIDRQLYLDHWSERHSYDVHGILIDNDSNTEVNARTDGTETPELVDKKLALLSDVSAFLIASRHSLLTSIQKEELMYRVGAFFDMRNRHYEVADKFGAAVAPYIAHEVEAVELLNEQGDFDGDERMERIRRGRFVLRLIDRPPYLRAKVGRTLSNGLRQAARN